MSDDGRWAVVVIALLGNPFSPHYARARRQNADRSPLHHCAMNVAVYGPDGSSWALCERTIGAAARSEHALTLGASILRWENGDLVANVDERTSPWRRRLRCRVMLHPEAPAAGAFALDARGLHAWWPVAPHGRIDVAIDDPAIRFRGAGYHDVNAGAVPLEETFSHWTWSRARLGPTRTAIAYDVCSVEGEATACSLDIDEKRGVRPISDLGFASLPTTAWRMDRRIRTDRGAGAEVMRDLEDTPFYSRALVRSRIAGVPVTAMHETLSMARMKRRWVQFLLGFRMGKESP